MTTAHPVLDICYENVVTLENYLRACLPDEVASQLVQTEADSASYVTLLRSTLVAWNGSQANTTPLAYNGRTDESLEETIKRVQRDILLTKSTNCIALGYVQARLRLLPK